jgi:hypothetical protein
LAAAVKSQSTSDHSYGDIMKKQRCPYKSIFRNVHIRRAFVIFGVPLVALILLIELIAEAALDIKKNMSDFIHDAIKAFKDGNSYD